MLVYRAELEDGSGPLFRPNGGLGLNHVDWFMAPFSVQRGWLFACTTLEQLRTVFESWQHTTKVIRVREYEVCDMHVIHHFQGRDSAQVQFHPAYAVRRGSFIIASDSETN